MAPLTTSIPCPLFRLFRTPIPVIRAPELRISIPLFRSSSPYSDYPYLLFRFSVPLIPAILPLFRLSVPLIPILRAPNSGILPLLGLFRTEGVGDERVESAGAPLDHSAARLRLLQLPTQKETARPTTHRRSGQGASNRAMICRGSPTRWLKTHNKHSKWTGRPQLINVLALRTYCTD